MSFSYPAVDRTVDSIVFIPLWLPSGTKPVFEVYTILCGQTLPAGAVLGRITASGKLQLAVAAAGDGSQVPMAVLQENLATFAADGVTPLDMTLSVAVTGYFNAAALYFGRRRFRIEELVTYKKALEACKPFLYAYPGMQAPREVKRFVNLSRYLAVRINAVAYRTSSWTQRAAHYLLRVPVYVPEPVAKLEEDQIVVLTALHLARPQSEKNGDLAAWLIDPMERVRVGTENGVPGYADPAYGSALRSAVDSIGASTWPPEGEIRKFLRVLTEVSFGPSEASATPNAAEATPA